MKLFLTTGRQACAETSLGAIDASFFSIILFPGIEWGHHWGLMYKNSRLYKEKPFEFFFSKFYWQEEVKFL